MHISIGQQPFIRAGQLMFGSYRGLCKNLQACGYLWVDNKVTHGCRLSGDTCMTHTLYCRSLV